MLPPEPLESGAAVARDLSSISRRLRMAEGLTAVAIVAPVAGLIAAVLPRLGVSGVVAGLACAAAALAAWVGVLRVNRAAWTRSAAAHAIERAIPGTRNIAVTAEELIRHPDRARPWIRSRVLSDAAAIVGRADRAVVVPLTRRALVAIAAIAAGAGIPFAASAPGAAVVRQAADRVAAIAGGSARGPISLVATVAPPSYTGDAPRTIENPERIDALRGSTLRLLVRGGSDWHLRFSATSIDAKPSPDGLVAELTLTESGYLALEPRDADAKSLRRLVPVSVAPDRAPTIRIEQPGKDLLFPDAKPVVGVAAQATDDFGLQSLELKYTKVSGSGEQFEFQEGSLPLDVTHDSARSWKARAQIALSALGLAPGDAIIYRILGRDRRPGDAGLATSDTFFIEVAGPGQVALAGFELPPDRERYALSQPMIVLKLERLRARERTIDRATLEEEVAGLAAEQRAVRANFVFLMGGHVEDEEEEAEHSDEIQEGRLENTARKEISTAIQHMGRVEQGLAAVSTGQALPPARAAVEALQRAFGRNRYFLRTLPVRSRVDPSRRLTGELSSAADWKRELVPPAPDAAREAARNFLARLIEASPQVRAGTIEPSLLTTLAEEALAVDPSATEWQTVSRNLIQLRDGLGRSGQDRVGLFNQALAPAAALSQRQAIAPTIPNRDNAALRSALAEERRR